jgi:hypothetical protein
MSAAEQAQPKAPQNDSIVLIANIVEASHPQTVKMVAHLGTLDELLDVFERFLIASGYGIEGHLKFVKDIKP